MMNKNICKCPNCDKDFDIDEHFSWQIDHNHDPCVEYVSCPHCGVSTEQNFSCHRCPIGRANKCELEEECGACVYFKFEEFEKNVIIIEDEDE